MVSLDMALQSVPNSVNLWQKFIGIMLLSFRIGKTTFGVFKHLVRMNVSGLMYNCLRLASSVIQHLGNPIQRALKILLILIIKQILKLLCWLSDIISIILSFSAGCK